MATMIYSRVQKVLADPKVLGRGLAATEVPVLEHRDREFTGVALNLNKE